DDRPGAGQVAAVAELVGGDHVDPAQQPFGVPAGDGVAGGGVDHDVPARQRLAFGPRRYRAGPAWRRVRGGDGGLDRAFVGDLHARVAQPGERRQLHPALDQLAIALDHRAADHAGAEQGDPAAARTGCRGVDTGHLAHASTSCGAAAAAAVLLAMTRWARSSAAARSACRSAWASMPTDSRSSPSGMPAAARASGVIAAWVIVAGCATRLSTPPSDSARVNQRSPSTKARTASTPPPSSSDSIAPKPDCWRAASLCPGCDVSPG